MDFSETIVVYDIKVGRFSQLNEYMNMNIKGHSLTFVQGHSDSTISNFFFSETTRPIEAKWRLHGMWGMKICSNIPGHITMPIYGQKLKKFSSSELRGR